MLVHSNGLTVVVENLRVGTIGGLDWTGLLDSPKSFPELVPRLKLQYHWCALIRIIVRQVAKIELGKAPEYAIVLAVEVAERHLLLFRQEAPCSKSLSTAWER